MYLNKLLCRGSHSKNSDVVSFIPQEGVELKNFVNKVWDEITSKDGSIGSSSVCGFSDPVQTPERELSYMIMTELCCHLDPCI